jgi:hypothetical protein
MTSLTTWFRIEAHRKSNDLETALSAQIRDPAWMLARQWQVGEFRGVDSGSPISVEVATETLPFSTVTVAGQTRTFGTDAPAEAQTMSEPIKPDIGLRVELANIFINTAAVNLPDPLITVSTLRSAFPLDLPADPILDPDNAVFLQMAAARSFDGYKLYVANPATIPNMSDGLLAVVNAFKSDVLALYPHLGLTEQVKEPESWNPATLENTFEITASDAGGRSVKLRAHPSSDGRLDWDSFDLVSTTTGTTAPGEAVQITYPGNFEFPGMPSQRFWNFEDSRMNLPRVVPQNNDTVLSLLLYLTLIQGVDWFFAACPAKVGSVVRIRRLVVKDVFGVETIVHRADEPVGGQTVPWTMFRNTPAAAGGASGDFLVVPPSSLDARQTSAPVEEILFARDEMANMVWAVEQTVETGVFGSWRGQERAGRYKLIHPDPAEPSGAIDPNVPLRYQIETKVPINWIPFLPKKISTGSQEIHLVEGQIASRGNVPTPAGKVLRPGGSTHYIVREEEVPREGVRVRRVYVRSRWTNGKASLWMERQAAIGRGESQAGLRFDQSIPNREET